MATIEEIASDYIEQMAAADPIEATAWGVPGHEDRLPDLSPAGIDARVAVRMSALKALAQAIPATDVERIAAGVMTERLTVAQEMHEAGEDLRPLRVISSPQGQVRRCFDLMPRQTEEDWQNIAARLAKVPAALDQLRVTLNESRRRRITSPVRQVEACARQCDQWGGAGGRSFFASLVAQYEGGRSLSALERGAREAEQAYLELADWLRQDYLPDATTQDMAGRERYALCARYFTGSELDLDETYRFGWDELGRIEAEMARVANRILPDAPLPQVVAQLESDPTLVIDGTEAFRTWNQELIDRTIEELNGVHFDIAPPIRRCEAMIAPPGGAAAMYYTGPSEDFSRPGRTWYPTLGKTRFPLWREVSVCYHEGVPGHHLQVAQVRYRTDRLNRFQRLAGFTSGHGEGWALYAERLMGELGYLENPAFELGMLAAQAMRAVRVIVDIGMHLELGIPSTEDSHPGERWTPELALAFVIERSRFPSDFMASEVDRYLGMPGQAIAYKVGERAWLEGRARAKMRRGAAFDLKDFHRFALDLGGMGLDQLSVELDRY